MKANRNIHLRNYKYIPCVYLLLSSCITPYNVNSEYQEAIVVQGMITDQPGPYQVTVSKTIPINQQGETLGVLTGASVEIQDDQGYSEKLIEKSSGNFYTQNIQGVIGNSYTITITTQEGYVYQSSLEKLLPVGDFSNLHFQFVQHEPPDYASYDVNTTNGFNIYIDSNILPEQENRVWWRRTGTYHVYTYAGFEMIDDGTFTQPVKCSFSGPWNTCTCCDCWVTEYNQSPLISDPKFVNNGKINNYNIAFVQASRRTMYDKYHLEIEQLSLSKQVYNFWSLVQIQQSNSSNLFQTPPPKTTGNITATTPNATPVIGYFAASSVKSHAIEMTAADVPYFIQPIDSIKYSCLEVFKNSTNQKPTFW